MRILLTGATGYIGQRLLPALIREGHTVICCTRDKARLRIPESLRSKVEVFEVDFTETVDSGRVPGALDVAYYLMHSMSSSEDYQELELQVARNFSSCMDEAGVNQVVYLSGMVNENELSTHLASRKAVEEELSRASFSLTALRAAIIIGSGSASFEIIRDLVEKLPFMIAPRWLKTRCQPIGIRDVISCLISALGDERTYDKNYDIAGPDLLTYREMLLGYAKARGLKRTILTVPVMTPRLSSYWLYFVTSTSYALARSLVDSMKVEVIARDSDYLKMMGIHPLPYPEALSRTLQRIEQNEVVSSWKDAASSGRLQLEVSEFLKVPTFGCFIDERRKAVKDSDMSIDRIWRIGGDTGWYYGNWLWRIRGYMDKLAGGVGLRRGRTHVDQLHPGDALDFWRVLYANRSEGRLLLFAEMRLPGEAWLEFRINGSELIQRATFRPKGVWGRLYWFAVLPFHGFIFDGMASRLAAP